ncbi:MAG: PEP-CTERM sorting domain-containing protein, partial [Geobacteraceae bacterium]|nr:PEP-CTERM sorting domain-containing protein [Geobacteraceae bacterium]
RYGQHCGDPGLRQPADSRQWRKRCGGWFVFGKYAGGYLSWDSSLPDVITLAGGNRVRIDFQDILAAGAGDSVMVHASVTNLGAAPVPEPGTIILLGAGLAGLGIFGRRKMKLRG